ncbi:DUF1428 family protein [Solibacillus sp. A46]|uniref:DUF1428 family protein n=1 Tax=Solibacillus faecavium TaxID=2762221 RepID=A0ABR8Y314_9BACL|nr:DUF1428 family protein [Solibacillus faecavium]MBD8038483.1 DUF1428 family protein [Solibacillus faecavium]
MYLEIYLYPVPEENKEQFLKINREAERIYKEYGALESETFTATSIQPGYGCIGMISAVELLESEILMLEINRYDNKEHHSQVLEKVDNDEQIEKLYNQVIEVIDLSRTVRGEFEFL